MKKIIALLLALVMLVAAIPVTGLAASDEATQAAQALYELGLFQGTGTNANGTPNFDLDRTPTRHEAVTMLVRLLGKDAEAQAGTWEIPFTDVDDWAKPYVGYAYANGLTTGTSETTFGGADTIDAAQYLTFVLRALGYESGTDFQWDDPWELSDGIGLTSGNYNADNTMFARADVAIISNIAISKKEELMKPKTSVTLYAADGRTIDVWSDEVADYLKVGWFETPQEKSIDNLVNFIKENGETKSDGKLAVSYYTTSNYASVEDNQLTSVEFIYDPSQNTVTFRASHTAFEENSSGGLSPSGMMILSFDYDVARRRLGNNPSIEILTSDGVDTTATTYLNMSTYTTSDVLNFAFDDRKMAPLSDWCNGVFVRFIELID